MFRPLLLLVGALAALSLVYTFGFGLLIAFAAIAAATLLFSNGQAQESEATQGGQTDYHTTRFAGF
ncbi:hypothetical protein [Variovorax sp. MHTC-1]|uniref:hypothetical protein n=1 Tax=Variovorax sp. MHTC-1 TaxID=2495593 RepID=UPI000F8903C7|nr:hypothetical protein [Variovorax sp. MHTC-1]RST49384.1 hypothetical protein EJI01_24140 [Variovorax sp. MHTC-1]